VSTSSLKNAISPARTPLKSPCQGGVYWGRRNKADNN
jgi:hypothetical protein